MSVPIVSCPGVTSSSEFVSHEAASVVVGRRPTTVVVAPTGSGQEDQRQKQGEREEALPHAVRNPTVRAPGRRTSANRTLSRNASAASAPSERGSVVTSATPPTAAGPTRKPRYMSVVSEPTTVPRSPVRAARPATLTIVGAQTEHPAPAIAMPASATGTEGARAASAEPTPASAAPTTRTVFSVPGCAIRCAASRPTVIAAANSAGPRELAAGGASSVRSR